MNELTINGFSALTEEEMMMVDAGGWIKALCIGAGALIGGLLPGTWYIGAAAGAAIGEKIGDALEN